MANGYTLPPWLTPSESSPFQALVAGAQVGANIARNRQQARALAAQTQHQAFQDRVLHEKFQADAQDLQTLQAWWPTFTSAEGDALQTLRVPPLKNAQMWSQITMEVGKKKQQAAASALASSMGSLDLSTPEGQASYYQLASQAAKTGLPLTIEQIQGPVFKAQELKRLQATAESTASLKELEAADRFEKEAAEVEGTDSDLALKLRQRATLLRSKFTSPTETIETYTDERGNQQVRVVRGPAGTKSGLTGAVATDVQRQALSGETAALRGVELLNTLRPEDVGVRGVINEVAFNKVLSQFFPGVEKPGVTDARTLLRIFNEQMLKNIKPDAQMNKEDVARLLKALPSLDATESLGSVQKKITRFMDESRQIARVNAEASKQPVPDWAWTQDEVVKKFESGEWDRDKAYQILLKYHP